MKYLSIDVETTGRNPNEHKVIMFAAILDDLNKPRPVDNLPFYSCIINQEKKGEPYALEMNEWIFKEMPKEGISQAQFIKEFTAWLNQQGFEEEKGRFVINVAGKNVAGFDNIFLKNIPGFTDRIRIRSRCIDPTILFLDKKDEHLPDLQTCLERAGIQKRVSHNALEDALDIVQLIRESSLVKQ
jgi:oligoribonuclease (3'-5' exoribonuclease)